MIYFESDYTEGAHEKVLQALVRTNMDSTAGYGTDVCCAAAAKKVLAACQCPEGQVFFFVGGTMTNSTVLTSLLAPHEAVVAVDTGHIADNECGTIEHSGHKVLTLPNHSGKMDPEELQQFLFATFHRENKAHLVTPAAVYISHPTELGTLYTAAELTRIRQVCDEYGLQLYLDGARLGYGLAAEGTDVTLPLIAKLCDCFYIGGTKVGALFGEAAVFTHNNAPRGFFSIMKQHGALLAKGRLLGVQFNTLFTDDLYYEIGRHGVTMAKRLKEGALKKGYKLLQDSVTNQQFIILDNKKMEELSKEIAFHSWGPTDETHTAVRFVTSWATKEEDVDRLLELM